MTLCCMPLSREVICSLPPAPKVMGEVMFSPAWGGTCKRLEEEDDLRTRKDGKE